MSVLNQNKILATSITQLQFSQSPICHFSPQVYFVCSDSRAVLNDESGINMFGVSCPSDPIGWENADLLDFPKANNISWPKCIIHSSCDDLPMPNNASGLIKFTEDDYVEVGEYVEYACIRRGEFYETADVSYIYIRTIFSTQYIEKLETNLFFSFGFLSHPCN